MEGNGFQVTGAEFTRIPNDQKDVTPEQRETIDKMVDILEDDDEDVQNVYTNIEAVWRWRIGIWLIKPMAPVANILTLNWMKSEK